MKRKLPFLFLILGYWVFGQECPDLTSPLNGQNNVPVDTAISWEEVVGVTGYIISLGTTPGGGEIVNEQAVGIDTTFLPPLGLPESTQIFVTITLFLFDQPDIVCPSQSFTTAQVTTLPDCSVMTTPLDGQTNVNVGTFIQWSYAPRATGYLITIGTAPGSGDIVDQLDVGNTLTYNPPADFPPSAEIFVLIEPYNEIGRAQNCQEFSFLTGELGQPPGCTRLITPPDGAINVPLTPFLEWEAVPGATGYIVNIGSSPFENDVLDGGIFTETSTFVINFEPNRTYFVEIIPFNDAGEAQGCIQESFSTILGCGPFFDQETGELVDLKPEIDFPDSVGICSGQIPAQITTQDTADGFRWYKIQEDGTEIIISSEPTVNISSTGLYRYEAYNTLIQEDFEIECVAEQVFEVEQSSIATIQRVKITPGEDDFDVSVLVTGEGVYEYSLDENGPYQPRNEFLNLPEGAYVVYVRDINGCGIASRPFNLAFPPGGFPPYFSPNGDGINDFWQYIAPRQGEALPLTVISIFDRFGKLLGQVRPGEQGWDGLYNGNPLPSDGYWYKAETSDNRVFTGYFSLVR
ncbi:T9SS type B sorting domain-containing protein [Aureitalea marina]|uniref:Fibronectin type-III domain-containing protein n=1 Tax=Aureitalea marina TaxID=930804 RepID=A0A2S7KS46_9FLAO|nr:T9SS type B sorting domain-containing protein [Aureitalea marina]PQB05398.1 hypothetical protein BST85_11240 [Aureitalea marina]